MQERIHIFSFIQQVISQQNTSSPLHRKGDYYFLLEISTQIPTDIGELLHCIALTTRGTRVCAEEDIKVDDEGAVCRGGERRKADRRAVGVRSSSSSWSPTVGATKVPSIELGSPGVPALPKILFTTHAGYYRKYYRRKGV